MAATAADYKELYGAIQEAFDPEYMNESSLRSWFNRSGSGINELASRLSKTKDYYNEIGDAYTYDDLDKLRNKVSSLDVHRETLNDMIDDKLRSIKPIEADIEDISEDLYNQGKISKVVTSYGEYNRLSGREKGLISNELRRAL